VDYHRHAEATLLRHPIAYLLPARFERSTVEATTAAAKATPGSAPGESTSYAAAGVTARRAACIPAGCTSWQHGITHFA